MCKAFYSRLLQQLANVISLEHMMGWALLINITGQKDNLLTCTKQNVITLFTDLGENGSYFMNKRLSVFSSDVLQLLIITSE